MMMERFRWQVRDDPAAPGAWQMAQDEALARDGTAPTARLFRWAPGAVSFGRSQPLPAWLEALSRQGLNLVRRPTGGGIAFHGTDVSLALIVPCARAPHLAGLLALACRATARLCAAYGAAATCDTEPRRAGRIVICLTEESPYAVRIAGRKVAGFAARRFPLCWLVHGSVLVRPVAEPLRRALPPSERAALEARATSLSDAAGRELDETDVAARWARQWGIGSEAACEPEPAAAGAAQGPSQQAAEPPSGGSGFGVQGWGQARVHRRSDGRGPDPGARHPEPTRGCSATS